MMHTHSMHDPSFLATLTALWLRSNLPLWLAPHQWKLQFCSPAKNFSPYN